MDDKTLNRSVLCARASRLTAFLVCVVGCNQTANESNLAVQNSVQHIVTATSPVDAKTENKIVAGAVARVEIDDSDREKDLTAAFTFASLRGANLTTFILARNMECGRTVKLIW